MDQENNNNEESLAQSFTKFSYEIIKAINHINENITQLRNEINELKKEVHDFKKEMYEFRDEMYEFKKENQKRWEQYEENREKDRKEIIEILTSYENNIAEALGNPNVHKISKYKI